MDALWKDASEELRRELARMLPDLMEMAEDASINLLEGSHSFADMATVARLASAATKADPDLPFLAAGGLTLWRRFGLRSLPYFVELLPYALFQASQPGQRMEAVKAYIGNRVDIEAWLEVLRELSMGDAEMILSLIAETSQAMLDRFRDDRIALARALDYAAKSDVPLWIVGTSAIFPSPNGIRKNADNIRYVNYVAYFSASGQLGRAQPKNRPHN